MRFHPRPRLPPLLFTRRTPRFITTTAFHPPTPAPPPPPTPTPLSPTTSLSTNLGAMPSGGSSPVTATCKKSFYMRELPKDKLVGYDTPKGKELFKDALLSGGLEAFFPLSQQFLTQNEPAFCGLGTLCMILNALKIDPAATWRKPWRWFTQEMLDCCRPLEWVKQNGITLAEFTCLAKCNGLDATTQYANQTTFDEFEQAVNDCTQSTDQLLAVSYSRASLGQTGSGHFSPVAGYTSMNGGMVLILDVARFKYPSYWVPIRALFEALIPPDSSTGQPRGYSILRRPPTSQPSPVLLTLNATTPVWPTLYKPLAFVASAASSYASLTTELAQILASPSGLPTVTSRFHTTNSTSAQTHSPSFDANVGAQAHSDYRRGVARLHRYFAENSTLYAELTGVDELWKTEITVFMLALLSSRDLTERMTKSVRREVGERLRDDLEDETIQAEVAMVRKQLESLTDCSLEEGSCSKPAGTCCAVKSWK